MEKCVFLLSLLLPRMHFKRWIYITIVSKGKYWEQGKSACFGSKRIKILPAHESKADSFIELKLKRKWPGLPFPFHLFVQFIVYITQYPHQYFYRMEEKWGKLHPGKYHQEKPNIAAVIILCKYSAFCP